MPPKRGPKKHRLGKLAKPQNLARNLVKDGRRGRDGCARPDETFSSDDNATTLDIYQQFVPESQQRVANRLSALDTSQLKREIAANCSQRAKYDIRK